MMWYQDTYAYAYAYAYAYTYTYTHKYTYTYTCISVMFRSCIYMELKLSIKFPTDVKTKPGHYGETTIEILGFLRSMYWYQR